MPVVPEYSVRPALPGLAVIALLPAHTPILPAALEVAAMMAYHPRQRSGQ